MTDTSNIIRDIYSAYAARDIDAVAARLADDARFVWSARAEFVPHAGTVEGRSAFVDRLNALDEVFTFQSYEPIDLICDGDRAAARIHATVTGKGTGRTEKLELAHFWRLRDGKATELVEFYDTALVAQMN